MIEIYANITTANPTLGAVVSTTPAAGTVETWTFATTSWGTGLNQVPIATTSERIRASVDNEIVYISNVNSGANTASVTRGALGSSITTHANGAAVTFPKSPNFILPAYLTNLTVNQSDYFVNSVISGFAVTTSNQTVNIGPGVAVANGFRGILAETQTISGLSFSTNYWIRFNAQTGVVSAVQATSGANQIAAANQITLYYAAVGASPGAVTTTDLRQVGMINTPVNALVSSSTGNLIEPPNAAPTWSAASGSSMVDTGNHVWAYTWLSTNGESVPSPISTSTTTIASGTQSITVTIPAFPTGVIAARIYRTKTGASYAATAVLPLYYVGSIVSGTTFTDQIPDASITLPAPSFVDSFSNTQTTGHFLNMGRVIPTIANGTNVTAGLSADSTDTRGTIQITAGSTQPLANATLCTITFGTAYLNIPHIMITMRADATYTGTPVTVSAGFCWYVYTPSNTSFIIRNGVALTASAKYSLDYWVCG